MVPQLDTSPTVIVQKLFYKCLKWRSSQFQTSSWLPEGLNTEASGELPVTEDLNVSTQFKTKFVDVRTQTVQFSSPSFQYLFRKPLHIC